MALDIEFNPDLDLEHYRRVYAEQRVVQVADIFTSKSAEQLYDILAHHTPWQLTLSDEDGKARLYAEPDIKAGLYPELGEEIHKNTLRSGEAFGYIYLCYPMIDKYTARQDPGHPIHLVTEFLNSEAMVALCAYITDRPDVLKLDAHATCYRPNDYLNLHDDKDRGHRAAAYTLGLTKAWRPDWGGQLLMHDGTGDIRRGFTPRFNALTLFEVPTLHSVAPVAPYARHPRYMITGWLKTEPKGE